MSGGRRPGYWAVLPATVRYDKTLRPNAKLL
ncbi:MAG: helix-turn-helix domain-containing protein, partial [Oscillospiraceae bacterium]|nr:helix-turn-helix domain-containing protein [Oscillospiraceae bacterium]